MATVIRPEISERSNYWVSKHSHYELKHFCRQYSSWARACAELDGFRSQTNGLGYSGMHAPSDVTAKYVELRSGYLERMDLVRRIAYETDPALAEFIFQAVTEGLSYTYLKAKLGIPCSKDTYYNRYRRFFWLLSKARG